MAVARAPKQWPLTKNETITTFEAWRQNLTYILSLDANFAVYMVDGATWRKKSTAVQNRGFTNDGDDVVAANRKTAAQKAVQLELMLGQIANYCPIISRNSIVKNSVSLPDIWQKLRQHYGFQSSGSHFLDLSSFRLQTDERPEDFYQRLMAFFEDNLLTTTCQITHHGEALASDEEMTPTLENTVVLMWLQLINPGLPQLVKQKYGAELRNKTLASLKPEISQAMTSLLDELRTLEDSKVFRSMSNYGPRNNSRFQAVKKRVSKSCILCKTAGRSAFNTHSLLDCKFLPENDRQSLGRSRVVHTLDEEGDIYEEDQEETELSSTVDTRDDALLDSNTARRVNIIQSPYLKVYYKQHPVSLTIDTGATTNMIRACFATHIGLPVKSASQLARQADGVTPLDVVGEVHCTLTREGKVFQLDALVVKQLDVDVLAGNPFMVTNDIATRPAKKQIVIGGSEIVFYGQSTHGMSSVRRTQAFVLRAPNHQTVVLPGEFIEVKTPTDCETDVTLALESRDSDLNPTGPSVWPPPQEIESVGHAVRIVNTTEEPVLIRRHEHFCQVRVIHTIPEPESVPVANDKFTPPAQAAPPYSAKVSLNPDSCLTPEMHQKFRALNEQYDDVFNPTIAKYNGHSGKIEATVNMGPVMPPQRKGRLPQYNRSKLVELQQKFDELEAVGVFAKPDQVNVAVEYLNLSFLVRKPNGGNRLVTAFGEVGQYSKPQPSLMPNVNSTLRDIAGWKYIIVSDLLKSFYQIPLSHASMKYCGVATPFKGIRVYTRCAMGMPGSETALEELMSRVLGDLIQEGIVTKIADDLYCGGNTAEETLSNWSRVLLALSSNNLRLSASKTVICPKSTNILGWIWSQGTLKASPHKVASLAAVDPPKTVQGLRSFIGSYKVLSRVLQGYAYLLHPLESAIAGQESRDHVLWNDELHEAFKLAQEALNNPKTITLPCPDDQLWIVTDASVKKAGIGATLYISRNNHLLLAGFFNAKLRKHQVAWLPCEVEALCIGTAVKHFAPFIVQSRHTAHILTDSRPCVQAYDKLCRGEFSTSSRVTTFLSIVSRYQIKIGHIAGAANLPTDHASRNPTSCLDSSCQVCKFIAETEDSVVRQLSVQDVLEKTVPMPFTSRSAWRATQLDCPDLRRTHAHLTQGTRPSKKVTKLSDVKRYLKSVVIANDGLLVVPESQPFQPVRDRIVVPSSVIDGLLTALHYRFCHPSAYQMKKLASRYFFALNMDHSIQAVNATCHHCASLKKVSPHLQEQTTSEPPEHIGVSFAADVVKRYRQLILVLRDTTSSFTWSMLIDSEKHDCLRESILTLCTESCYLGQSHSRSHIRTSRSQVKVTYSLTFGLMTSSPITVNSRAKPTGVHTVGRGRQ